MTINFSHLMRATYGGDVRFPDSKAHHRMLAIFALFAGLAASSLWGLAAGSTSAQLALANAYKVPMVILMSAVAALPAGLVALKVVDASLPAHQLVRSFATSIFGGTLLLATLAPLVAVYYHTSSKAGVPLAIGTVFVSLATAAMLFARAVARQVAGSDRRGRSLIAVGVLVALFSAALLQFVAMASPIISAPTVFDAGFDGVFR